MGLGERMKLEVGMYVRTTQGKIDKIDNYNSNFNCYHLSTEPNCYGIVEDDVSKASNNIIDLIEVGDYVNGELVEYIEVDSYKDYVINSGYWCKQKDIKSIVTKEQFESISYKVGE